MEGYLFPIIFVVFGVASIAIHAYRVWNDDAETGLEDYKAPDLVNDPQFTGLAGNIYTDRD